MPEEIDHRVPAIAETIYQLQQASYIVESELIGYPASEFPPLQVTAEQIEQEEATFLGYRVGAQLVGVVSFAVGPRERDIGRLVVHPDFFRRGIAGALLWAVESRAGVGQTLTVSTAEENIPAVRLYEKFGYELTERIRLPNGVVLVRLTKTL